MVKNDPAPHRRRTISDRAFECRLAHDAISMTEPTKAAAETTMSDWARPQVMNILREVLADSSRFHDRQLAEGQGTDAGLEDFPAGPGQPQGVWNEATD